MANNEKHTHFKNNIRKTFTSIKIYLRYYFNKIILTIGFAIIEAILFLIKVFNFIRNTLFWLIEKLALGILWV